MRIFGRLHFCMVKYLSFHNSSFCLYKMLFHVKMARPHCCATPGCLQNLQTWAECS